MSPKPAKLLPLWWYVVLAVVLLKGILLVSSNPSTPPWLLAVIPWLPAETLSRVLGLFLISLVASDLLVFAAIRGVDKLFGLEGESTVEDLWPSTLVGVVEGIMYPISFLVGRPEFIGIWLAVKVAGQWVRWGTEFPSRRGSKREHQAEIIEAKRGRRRFNKFLIGNALRIILAGGTYLLLSAATYWR